MSKIDKELQEKIRRVTEDHQRQKTAEETLVDIPIKYVFTTQRRRVIGEPFAVSNGHTTENVIIRSQLNEDMFVCEFDQDVIIIVHEPMAAWPSNVPKDFPRELLRQNHGQHEEHSAR